ncbi:MAG: hypothetical protein R3B48_22745 [Kofleriaceae bacterium]
MAVAALALVACGRARSGVRQVQLKEITASYSEKRPDGSAWDRGLSPRPEIEGHLLVDGRAYGSCSKRMLGAALRCELEVDVALFDDSELKLIIEDNDGKTSERMGEAVLAHAGEALATSGADVITMKAAGSISEVKLRYTARRSEDALTFARIVAAVLGVLLALLLRWGLASFWYAQAEGERWNPARLSALLAIVLGGAITWPLAHRLDVLEPAVIALPLFLAGYATGAVILDAVVADQLSMTRIWLIVAAFVMAALVPAFVFLSNVVFVALVLALAVGFFNS